MNLLTIDKEKCIGCGQCALSCPYTALQQTQKGQAPTFYPEIGCIRCGHCVSVCPKDAITHNDMDMNQFIPIEKKIAPEDIELFLKSKRSVRNFSDKLINKETIERLINISCQAPTDANTEGRGFLVINNREKILKIETAIIEGFKQFITKSEQAGMSETSKEMKRTRAIIKYYASGGHPVFRSTSCVIFIYGPVTNIFSWYNCSLASDYLMLGAHSLGIESCIIGMALYEPVQLGTFLNLEQGQQIYSCITLGYPTVKYRKTVSRKKPNIIWQ